MVNWISIFIYYYYCVIYHIDVRVLVYNNAENNTFVNTYKSLNMAISRFLKPSKIFLNFFSVLLRYLNGVHNIDFPLDQFWHCAFATTTFSFASMCSTYLIISMTFERFYSIVRPHKAASSNTVNRAKKIISCTILCTIIFSIPHMFVTVTNDKDCFPYLGGLKDTYGLLYYWVSLIVHFIFPFISLLVMNSVIIHTLRKRQLTGIPGQGQNEGHITKLRGSEKHIVVTLLLVTFAFLILSTPSYVFLSLMTDNPTRTPYSIAISYLLLGIVGNMHYTNSGINFFLYVLSSRTFRADLLKLIKCNGSHQAKQPVSISVFNSVTNLRQLKDTSSSKI